MMNKTKLLMGLGLIILFVSGCNPAAQWKEQERALIQDYVISLGDTAYVLKPSGLYYIELRAGTGASPVTKDTVTFRFTGMFLDRAVFVTNVYETSPWVAVIGAYNLFTGLDEGIRYMKEGGKARLLIPSNLAFGSSGSDNGIISGYTPLLYEIDLVKVIPGPAK
jgi:FKBP-type peptidyl-prolyl cis-trans isomerase